MSSTEEAVQRTESIVFVTDFADPRGRGIYKQGKAYKIPAGYAASLRGRGVAVAEDSEQGEAAKAVEPIDPPEAEQDPKQTAAAAAAKATDAAGTGKKSTTSKSTGK